MSAVETSFMRYPAWMACLNAVVTGGSAGGGRGCEYDRGLFCISADGDGDEDLCVVRCDDCVS